jgi:hypothetical protein
MEKWEAGGVAVPEKIIGVSPAGEYYTVWATSPLRK